MLESDLGPDLPETFGSQSVRAAAGGEPDPSSMQAQGNATNGDASSASASLAGTTVQTGAAGGLVFNITYDSSVSSAPAGFTAAIADVVNYYTSVFSDPVTINIDVGWGEVGGHWRQARSARAKPILGSSAIRK